MNNQATIASPSMTDHRNAIAERIVKGEFDRAHHDYVLRMRRANGKEVAALHLLPWIKDDLAAGQSQFNGIGITHLRRAVRLHF
ncbi:hypothetical protein ACOPJQ_08760 [Luteimonas dalianensis]|uniref:hypothetical protein n=1 Tax=Luteimonas dalianensis TaxID=1148196 RepID=UPI003BF13608